MALLFTLPRSSPMDALGRIMPGGIVRFYEAGTSTPKAVYADADLTVALGPFIQAGDDGSLPIVYLDDVGAAYKVVVTTVSGQVIPNGTIDPYLTGPSSDQIGRAIYPRSDAERSAGVEPRDFRYPEGNVLRYGADPTGTRDSTAEIQAGIDVGQAVIFPTGDYQAAGLVSSADMQQFIAVGDVWINKSANGPIWTVNGRECLFERIKFNGRSASFTGDNLVIDASNCTLSNCGSRDAAGRAVLSTSGDNLRIIGTSDVYQTADQSEDSYDIELRGGGLYSRIIAITSSQHAGGILFDSANTASVIGCQVGKVTTINNGSVFLSASRVHTLLISGSNCTFSGNAIANGVVLGPDGVIVGGIEWSSSNVLPGGATFEVGENVRFSTLHLESMQETGAVITIHPTAEEWNCITSSPETYSPTLSSAGGGASIGNGTFSKARFSRNGRRVSVDVEFIFGGTTSFGSGAVQVGLPFPVSSAVGGMTVGTGLASDATGVHHVLIATALPGDSFVTFYADGVGNQVSGTTPFAWASPDRLRFTIEYPVSA